MLSKVFWMKCKAINSKQDTVNEEMGNKQRKKNRVEHFFFLHFKAKYIRTANTCKNMH